MTHNTHSTSPWHVEPFQWDQGASLAICNKENGVLAVIPPLNDAADETSAAREDGDLPNAYLMAAAPDLLSALQDAEREIVAMLEDLCDEPEADISAHRTLATIRAAIAQATAGGIAAAELEQARRHYDAETRGDEATTPAG